VLQHQPQKHELTSNVGECCLIRRLWDRPDAGASAFPSDGNVVQSLFNTLEASAVEPGGRARGYEPHLDFDAEEKVLTALTKALASPATVASC
jgi:hypothetical protein